MVVLLTCTVMSAVVMSGCTTDAPGDRPGLSGSGVSSASPEGGGGSPGAPVPPTATGRSPNPATSRSSETTTSPSSGTRPRPPTVLVPADGEGRYAVVRGEAQPPENSRGKVIRYVVEVEKGLSFDPEEFAAMVQRTLNDERSWGSGGRMRFMRVDHGPVRFRVALSSPAMTNAQCLPLHTLGELSCWNGRRSVINAKRWAQAIPAYHGDLVSYRQYVINHEVGHALGHGHQSCPGPGERAPVMSQQTKSMQGCRPNAWPFPDARNPVDGRGDSRSRQR